MNLHGSITKHQNTLIHLYLDLGQNFNENQLIRDLWNAMANDISQQRDSLNTLPRSFWNQLKKEQNELQEAIRSCAKIQIADKKDDMSLRFCFDQALRLEEPMILKIYAPMIRKLREGYKDQALDFYIKAKGHLVRITRMVEAFSGDPLAVQQSNLLLQSFEKEIQEPRVEEIVLRKKPAKRKLARVGKVHARTTSKRAAQPKMTSARKTGQTKRTKAKRTPPKESKRAHPLAERRKILSGRSKRLVEKVGVHRRRARR